MALDVFEEIVASWLQSNGFFMMNNIKYGNNQEIDILATKKAVTNEVIHIEVTCSSNPLSLLGTTEHGEKDYENCTEKYLQKKYLNDSVIKKIKEITDNNIMINRWFIHAKLKESKQLEMFKRKGIKTIHIHNIVKEIEDIKLKQFIGDKRIKQLFDILKEMK